MQISGWTKEFPSTICQDNSNQYSPYDRSILFSVYSAVRQKTSCSTQLPVLSALDTKTTFPSVLTPTLCPVSQQRKLLLLLLLKGQSWAAVWEKVKKRTDKSLWGVFWLPNHLSSSWELSSQSQETPCYSYSVDKTAADSHFTPAVVVWTQPPNRRGKIPNISTCRD